MGPAMMMRMAHTILRASSIAVAIAGCCADDGGTWHVLASRSEYGTKVDDCIADADRCWPLCYAVLGDDYTQIEDCRRGQGDPDGIWIAIDYSTSCER